jgi:capsular exopolysaccharide synthesis family protein
MEKAPSRTPPRDNRLSTADLRWFIGALLRNLKLVLALPLAAVGLAYGVLHFVKPLYGSTTEILAVDTKRANDPVGDRRLSPFDVDQAAVASEIALIMSQSVALRVVKQLKLDTDPEFLHSPFETFFQNVGLSKRLASNPTSTPSLEGSSRDLERAIYELRERHLKVERQGLSYVLAISATSTDPLKAERISTAVAQAYVDAQIEVRIDGRRRAVKSLEQRLNELRSRVLDAESAIEKLKAANGLIDTGNGANIGTQAIGASNSQLSAAQAEVEERKARYEQARDVVDKGGDIQSIPDVMSAPVIGQLRVQLADAMRHEAELRSRFGARYPEVGVAQSQVREVRGAISAEVRRILENMKNSYSVAVQREQALKASLELKTEKRGDSNAVVRLAELKRRADADRKIYEEFLAKANDLEEVSTLDLPGTRIITTATVPTAPSSPRKTLIYVLVVVLASALALALALALEYLNPTFKVPSQVESVLHMPVVGMVPKLKVIGPSLRLPWVGAVARKLGGTMPRLKVAGPGARLPWISAPVPEESRHIAYCRDLIMSPSSHASEAIRTIRTLLALGGEGAVPRVFMVTSSMPAEGKSTFSLLFAVSAAVAHNRTVLVDCDLRRGLSSRALHRGRKVGLADYLGGKVGLSDVIYQKKALGLSVIPCGKAVRNPTDLLSSEKLQEMIAHLRREFDYIVLDTPPILPVVDSTILAKCVDRVLFVIRWEKTPRRCVIEAMKGLLSSAQSVTSLILNDVDQRRLQSYGYGYGAGYNYGRYYRLMRKYYEGTSNPRRKRKGWRLPRAFSRIRRGSHPADRSQIVSHS